MNRGADPVRFVLSRPLAVEPGTLFNYSGRSTQLLAAAVQRAAGRPLLEYAREVLFGPLGILHARIQRSEQLQPSIPSLDRRLAGTVETTASGRTTNALS